MAWLSLWVYGTSLFFSCYHFEGETQEWMPFPSEVPGLLLLMIGWIGLFEGEYPWLANPLWFMAGFTLMLAGGHRSKVNDPSVVALVWIATGLCIGSLIIALTFAFQSSTYLGRGAPGSASKIGGLGPGYLLWVTSIVLMTSSAVCYLKSTPDLRSEPSEERSSS